LSPSHTIGSVNAISITEESPSHDGEQVINLNKNNLSPSHTNDKIPPNDQWVYAFTSALLLNVGELKNLKTL
jgi:hypothetical protein